MAGSLRARTGWAGASLLALALAIGPAPQAQAQTLRQQVRDLSGEIKTLREHLEGVGRQLDTARQEDAVATARRQATEQSLRDWVAESIRRTERVEELSAAGDQRLAAASAASEAGVRATIEQLAQRLGQFEKELAGLNEIGQLVARLDGEGAARAREQTAAVAELGARLEQSRIVFDERFERLERETLERFRVQAEQVAGLRGALDRIEQEDGARGQAMDAAVAETRQMIAGMRDELAALAGSQDPQLAERIRGNQESLDAMAQRVARLDQAEAERSRQLAATAREVQALVADARQGLGARIDGLDQAAAERARATEQAAAELRQSLARISTDLAERIARVEQQGETTHPAMADARLERLLGAAVHLSAITQTARPFARELAYVRQIGEGVRGIDGAINELLVHASRGAPTVADLRQSFEALAPVIVARASGPEDGWAGTAKRWATEAGSKFGVLDPPQPTAARLAVHNAEMHLARGQLAQAVGALAPLDAAALSQAATWIIHARSRIAIDQAATELVNRVMAQALTR